MVKRNDNLDNIHTIVDSLYTLIAAFEEQHMDAPVAIKITRRTYDILKMYTNNYCGCVQVNYDYESGYKFSILNVKLEVEK